MHQYTYVTLIDMCNMSKLHGQMDKQLAFPFEIIRVWKTGTLVSRLGTAQWLSTAEYGVLFCELGLRTQMEGFGWVSNFWQHSRVSQCYPQMKSISYLFRKNSNFFSRYKSCKFGLLQPDVVRAPSAINKLISGNRFVAIREISLTIVDVSHWNVIKWQAKCRVT